jgi:hypothetical protein
MTDTQLYLSIGVPILVNAAALGIVATLLMHHITAMAASLRAEMNTRFNALQETWRAELRRVEEVLDARLKHLEER